VSNDKQILNRLDQIRARYGSLPQEYIERLRPSVQKILTEDLPLLIQLVDAALHGKNRQFDDVAVELLDTNVRH
jgi:hypothetical protein